MRVYWSARITFRGRPATPRPPDFFASTRAQAQAANLGRVDEESYADSDMDDAKSDSRKVKGKGKGKARGGTKEEGSASQRVVRARTGRGGAGVTYRKDGEDAVDASECRFLRFCSVNFLSAFLFRVTELRILPGSFLSVP